MAEVKGTTFRLYWNTGSEGTPVYSTIGTEKDITVTVNAEIIDTTSKDATWATNVSNIKSWSVSGSAIHNAGDASTEQMIADIIAANQVLIEIKAINSKKLTGRLTLDQTTMASAYNDVVQLTFSGVGDGALVYEAE